MKRILSVAGIMAAVLLSASAQDEQQAKERLDKLTQELKVRAEYMAKTASFVNEIGVMGQPVLGAPFSATEVNESTQTLADGTKIHNEHQTKIYRDGAGRTRREMGNSVVIMDPVAKVRYTLNAERNTAMAVPMNLVERTAGGRGGVVTVTGPNTAWAVAEPASRVLVYTKDGEQPMALRLKQEDRAKSEDLGPQTMEGVVAQGTRTTRTIETGAIGNDRPINITSERWYSPQLQTVMMTKQDDPRSGENVFRLTDVKLGEPDPTLFQVPANYQVTDRK